MHEGICSTNRYELWVDALCIKQKNVEEQDQDVDRMRDICSAALNVAWIGEVVENSREAFALLDGLSEYYGPSEKMQRPFDIFRRDPVYFGVGGWHGVHQLFQRP